MRLLGSGALVPAALAVLSLAVALRQLVALAFPLELLALDPALLAIALALVRVNGELGKALPLPLPPFRSASSSCQVRMASE